MNKKPFVSLSTKIVLTIFLCLAAITGMVSAALMQEYVAQGEHERALRYKKAQSLLKMYEENIKLREAIVPDKLFFQSDLTPEQLKDIWLRQKKGLEQINPLNDTYMNMRRELLRDLLSVRDRDLQMDRMKFAIGGGLFLAIVFLTLMWLVIRRWILVPTEKMLDFTQKIRGGDLSARVAVSPKADKSDEMDLLARDLNEMADFLQASLLRTQEGQRFLQKLIDTLPDGLRVIDENFQVVMSNNTHRKMFGHLYRPECVKCFEQVGRDSPCDQDVNPCPLRMLKQNPDKQVKVIHRCSGADGREGFFEITAGFLDFQNRRMMLEVSRSLDKEIQFSHQQKLSSLGLLVGSVAHEMRNPLGSIRLILENIADRAETKPLSSEETKHYIELVLEQIGFCISVTSRLLKLARKPSEEQNFADLNEIVPETVSLLEYEAKKRGIEIVLKLSAEPVAVKASDTELRMVLVNLSQNAFHAMTDGGKLTIETKADADRAFLIVSDNGCGISAENLHRIFEPFFSENQENKAAGTGLGLSIVKSIVESAGGKIDVASTVGRGTTFTFVFAKGEK